MANHARDRFERTGSQVFVSVVITAYNNERFVAKAIESVLAQTHSDFELILVDDGSTDGTLDILRRYETRDARVRIVSHDNWGMARSANHAIELARSTWIVRMDADDVMMPNRIERQIAYVSDHPGIALASSLVHLIDAKGHVRWTTSSDLIDVDAFQRYRRQGKLMPIFHPAAIVNKAVFQSIGGYRPQFWPADDRDLLIRFAEQRHLMLIQPEPLLKYRVHAESVSSSATRHQYEMHRWARQCEERRRHGALEPSLSEFRRFEQQQPLLRRLNRSRRIWSHVLYRQSTVLYINGRRARAIAPLCAAIILTPGLWSGRVKSKLAKIIRRKLRRGLAGSDIG
ncbi:MAG TPA: glycosyltransferase [Thermomicrobiales bacterium]|nr:glycosyltransferase [Thermomicrobiales bacterium]